MASLVTGTRQGVTSAHYLETGVRQAAAYGELETGTSQGSTYYAVLETGTMQGCRPIAQDLVDTFIIPDPAKWETLSSGQASRLVLPIYEVRLELINSGVVTDLTPYIIDLSLDRILGGKSTFQCSLTQHSPGGFDENGYPLPDLFARMQVKQQDFNPLFLGRNAFTNKILSHRYDRTRTARISIRMETSQGYQTWIAPTMLLGTPRLNAEMGTLDWGGEDIITLLELEGQYRDDIVPSDGVINMAHATMRAIAADHGITSLVLNFPDYPIRQLRMSSGTPRQWMEEIAEPYQAHIYTDGDTLIFEPAKQVASATQAQWAWQDYLNIMDLKAEQIEGWKNKFVLTRLKDQSGVVSDGEQRCYGPQCVGTQEVRLSEPSNNVVLTLRRGASSTISFRNFVPKDEFGNYIGTPGQSQVFTSFNTKIHSIEFESVPYFYGGNTAQSQVASGGPSTLSGQTGFNEPNALAQFIPEYFWVIFGGSDPSANTTPIDAFDDPFSFTATDTATAAIWNTLPDGENIESSVIPNATVGQAAINALLFENVRKLFKATWGTPYINPWIRPNDVHDVSHYRSDQTHVQWLGEKISLNFDSDKKLTQNFEMYRGLIT